MLALLLIVTFGSAAAIAVLMIAWRSFRADSRAREEDLSARLHAAEEHAATLSSELEAARQYATRLSKWEKIDDAAEKARRLMLAADARAAEVETHARHVVEQSSSQAGSIIQSARAEADQIVGSGQARFYQLAAEGQATLSAAASQAQQVIAEAHRRAEEIAGEAIELKQNAQFYERAVKAMKNVIEGYGDEYIVPVESILDDLAEEFGHERAGQELKQARANTRLLIKEERAAKCDYVEASRREGAERFVLDAFNGKTDSILSRVRHDNHGKLEQEIRDAFTIVNLGGKSFRDARITGEYLEARLAELKWGVIAHELKKKEQDEQRAFKEWLREEQKAQREYEKAMRDAAREEDVLRKAMAQAQARITAATAEQRAGYEAQLAELNARLKEAEDRNQRALSMAQQTRRGHVYVISNIGSFGEHIYKVGLTRRLEPLDRIRELGDASVPFDFDVHAIILSDDAPALETQLHRHLLLKQVNKVNHRKEFFRINLTELRQELEAMGVDAHWTMKAEARQYRESLAIERLIVSDPAARQAWLDRQLTLDPVDSMELAVTETE